MWTIVWISTQASHTQFVVGETPISRDTHHSAWPRLVRFNRIERATCTTSSSFSDDALHFKGVVTTATRLRLHNRATFVQLPFDARKTRSHGRSRCNHYVMRWLQLRFELDSTAVRLLKVIATQWLNYSVVTDP